MTRDEVRAFFARQREHWRARDAEALAGCHTETGVVVSPIFRTVSGRRAILGSYWSLFQMFPDWDYRGDDLVIDGSRVAEPFDATATHVGEFMGLEGSGRRFQIQGVRLFKIEDGLIAHERRYYDFTGLLMQVGVLRGKPVP